MINTPDNTKFFEKVPFLQGVLIGYKCLKEALIQLL